jgi:hypothetical protein
MTIVKLRFKAGKMYINMNGRMAKKRKTNMKRDKDAESIFLASGEGDSGMIHIKETQSYGIPHACHKNGKPPLWQGLNKMNIPCETGNQIPVPQDILMKIYPERISPF